MNKDILCIGATHGNERVGIDAIALTLQEYNTFDWMIGNPRAFGSNVRFTEKDLNRCGQGDCTSSYYEERRAAEIQAIAQEYRYVVDIHGTYKDTGTFLLVTNPSLENLKLASFFDIETLVIWPSITPDMQYPLSEFFPCGIEIEVGDQDNPVHTQALAASLKQFLETYVTYEQMDDALWKERLHKKQIFEMYGDIPSTIGLRADMLAEQREITWNGETFIPIFIGTYPYSNILGYKLRRLTVSDFNKRFFFHKGT